MGGDTIVTQITYSLPHVLYAMNIISSYSNHLFAILDVSKSIIVTCPTPQAFPQTQAFSREFNCIKMIGGATTRCREVDLSDTSCPIAHLHSTPLPEPRYLSSWVSGYHKHW
jgi:hypothetical protein